MIPSKFRALCVRHLQAIFNTRRLSVCKLECRKYIICFGKPYPGTHSKIQNRDFATSKREPPRNVGSETRRETTQQFLVYSGRICLVLVVVGSGIYYVTKRRALREIACEAKIKSVESKTENKRKLSKPFKEAIKQAKDLCQRVKDESGSPGLVVAVSVDGHLVWTEGLGYADVENRLPCKPDTVMRIASISKSITMTAVAKQMEIGQLDLDKPIQAYVPHFPEKIVDGEKVKITTRDLVSHLSGIRGYNKDYMNSSKEKKNSPTKQSGLFESNSTDETEKDKNTWSNLKLNPEFNTREYFIKRHFSSTNQALELFKADPLVHKPGKYLYTSLGWTVITAVLEGATKQKFPDIVTDLFRDLGLENTYLDENEPLIYNRARFYAHNKKGKLVNAPYVDCSYKFAGGGMLSTAPDLVRFGNIMLFSYQHEDDADSTKIQLRERNAALDTKNCGNIDNTSKSVPGYLKSSTVQQIWKPVPNTHPGWDKDALYAMGWAVAPEKQTCGSGRKQRFCVSHTGGAVGASSVLLILPPSQEKDPNKPGHLAAPPKGVVVAIIVNMISVSLAKTALQIAKLFEEISVRTS